MSNMSKESREDALERILTETAKNPYIPKKQVRPAPRPNQPQNGRVPSRSNPDGIPVTRIPTEAQKAEAAKARAAKRVEEIKRARQQREALEKQQAEAAAEQYYQETMKLAVRREFGYDDEEEPAEEPETVSKKDKKKEKRQKPEKKKKAVKAEKSAKTERKVKEEKPEKKVKAEKKQRKEKSNYDDPGLWDIDSGALTDNNGVTLSDVLEIVEAAITVMFVVILFYTYIIRIAVVDGTSMNPTLSDSDRLVVRTVAYTPKDGDIVVIDNRSSHLISENGNVVETEGLKKNIVKRVIATGGQTVDIDFENGIVRVDGKALEENYISEPTTRDEYAFEYPLEVPEGYVFVMGDNRNISMDSRHPQIGLVPEERIIGEAAFRIYPFDRFGGID